MDRKPFEPETILIPAGSFLMGSDAVTIEMPAHTVTLPAYRMGKCMGKYPITNTEYAQFLQHNPQYPAPLRDWPPLAAAQRS